MSDVKLLFDKNARLGFVYLIWAYTDGRCDLVAIATSESIRRRYMISAKSQFPNALVRWEKAFVDHLYGFGLLTAVLNAAQKEGE